MRKKHNYNFISQSFKQNDCILISKEYVDSHQYLNYICSNGHQHRITWNNWQQGQRYSCKSNNMKPTYEYIDNSFTKEGYKLLSKEYKGAHKYLDYVCPNGHTHKMVWNNWQQGKRCPECPKKSFIDGSFKPEKEILKYIEKFYTGIIIPNDRTLIKNPKTDQYLELDIWLPEIRKAIEYNGAYWHSNKYQKYKDNIKKEFCKNNRINLLIIDHKEWRKNKDFNIINNFISIHQ